MYIFGPKRITVMPIRKNKKIPNRDFLNIWMGFIDNNFICPYFLQKSLNAESYERCLRGTMVIWQKRRYSVGKDRDRNQMFL